MERLGSIAFLFLCTALPTAMVALIIWRSVQVYRESKAWQRAIVSGAWSGEEPNAHRERLGGTRLLVPRAVLDPVAIKGDSLVAGYQVQRRHGPSTHRSLLIVRRRAPGPVGAIQHRSGDKAERLILRMVGAIGTVPEERPGWEWALVSPEGEWFPSAMSDALRDLLRPSEHLHLAAEYVVLSAPETDLHDLLRDERAEEIAML